MKFFHRGYLTSLIFMGLGLILLGFLLYVKLTPKADAQEFSAIPVEMNYPSPDLDLMDLAGNPISLDQLRGSVVLVNLWATWCPPCKAEMPTLQEYYEKYVQQRFLIVGINDGEQLKLVEPFIQEHGVTFPIWLDMGYKAEQAFGTINLPSSYVLDRQGIIRLMWIGAIKDKKLEQYVTPIIKEN